MKDLLIGVEIGGTKLQACLGTRDGEIVELCRGKVNLGEGKDGILRWFSEHIPPLIQSAGENAGCMAIGIGFGGPIDTAKGTIIKSIQVPGWDHYPLRKWFEDAFTLPAFLYNDSSVAGYGEYRLGSGKGCEQFFYTNIGSGIGGSLIMDSRLYDGQGYGAGEFGQVRVPDWTAERPGADAKLEALCSGWAIQGRLRKPGYVPKESCLNEMCGGNSETLDCTMLADAVRAGDPFALGETDLVAKSLAIALVSVLSLFQPQRVAFGGGVSLIGEPLFERIRLYTKEREFVSNIGRYDIVPCQLGESVVLNGALLMAANQLEQRSCV